MNKARSKQEFDWCGGGGRWGCKGGGWKEKKSTALKRKKKNGSLEIETCRVNEMAKAGIKCEQKKHKGCANLQMA